ncbi:PspC domain-containing protein [Novosphingobium sp.]|uniref:PspC domain-containing protein n=1 Tax=Novosphingobium sp. TaxID=1874826 RepID=UPI0035B2392D
MSAVDRMGGGNTPSSGAFRLDKPNARFMGVCSGIAKYFGWDVTLVRIAFALGTVFGFGSLLVIYLAIGLIAD